LSSNVRAGAALVLALVSLAAAADARPQRRLPLVPLPPPSNHVAFAAHLHDGRIATVYADGRVVIAGQPPQPGLPARAAKQSRALVGPRAATAGRMMAHVSPARYGSLAGDVPASVRRQIVFDLEHPPERFAAGRVIVAFTPGVTMTRDSDALSPAQVRALQLALLARRRDLGAHTFTTDARTNQTLAQLGVDRVDRLFSRLDRGTLGSLRARAESRTRHTLVPFDNAFVVHVGAGTVSEAARRLRALPGVAYASPDYAVQSMIAGRRPIPSDALREIAGYRRSPQTFGRSVRSARPIASAATPAVPANAAVAFDLQGMLNAPGVDAVAAFDEIAARFNQLPGTGVTVTNIGLGDAFDASAANDPNDPCNSAASGGAATTHLIGGQRYLDLPSMPLIPVWVSDAHGTLSPTADVCNVDPQLGEVGLDFSVMAPLPDTLQRPGKTAPLGLDLLGIAPGASYRWVAPGATNGVVGISDTLAAMIGAARQQPAPDVITASIGFGSDSLGFPGRYLEDDPLAQSIIAGIVASNVVVCIAANDGTRELTSAAVGPSGGSAPTNTGTTGTTTIDDVSYTTGPSVVPDSGAIDVGATTLDDIASANPLDPAMAGLANTKAFAVTRYNGTFGYSSGFGSRVNVSAPGDNISSFFLAGTAYDAVGLGNTGGTSASAPEVAAAAAVAIQVARLSGHAFASPAQVRDLLVATGTPVAQPPQADVALHVGPQVSVRRIVEQLLANAGKPVQPGVARVAVQGRRSGSYIAAYNERVVQDGAFLTALDPSYIRLDGPFTRSTSGATFAGTNTGADMNSYITIAPDWEGIPANATYRLTVAGQPSRVIATTPYARMLPAQLFAAAGVPLTPGASHTLSLTYRASSGLHALAESTFQLTFGPPPASSRLVLAPNAPPVVSGSSIPVTYDLRGYPRSLLTAPALDVSLEDIGGTIIDGPPLYSIPLTAPAGTVNVPVSALAGAGMYTMWIDLNPGVPTGSDVSDVVVTRVDAGTARPAPPLLSTAGGTPQRSLEIPYKGTFAVTYDVSQVPGASGAIIELAAPPPGPHFDTASFVGYNTVRNPNGNTVDDDGVITGAIYHLRASGTKGTISIDPAVAAIPPTTTVNVRILPTNGSVPIAEASDAGTLQYDGITSVFGMPLSQANMNTNGTDGVLMESGLLGSPQTGAPLFAIEPFDLQAPGAGAIALSFTNASVSVFPPVQTDVVVAEGSVSVPTFQYYRAAPASAGFSQFAFPTSVVPNTASASASALNSTPAASAFVFYDFATAGIFVTRGDVTTGNGFAPAIDITSQLVNTVDYNPIGTFSYDPGTDRAYMLVEDPSLGCDQQAPKLLTVDFANGTASTRVLGIAGGSPFGQGYGLAIDPATHVAAIITGCQTTPPGLGHDRFTSELTLVDLASGTATRVFQHVLGIEQSYHGFVGMIGGDSATVGIDAVNHLILERSMWCPTLIGTFDVNARPCLNEYDETGRLVKTVANLFDGGYDDPSPFFNGVNGTTRTGVALGQEALSENIYSTSLQPYSY
jgi:Subtilase family